MHYQTLLFDVDDTLLDFQAAEQQALTFLFRDLGMELTEDINQSYSAFNRQLWREYEAGKIDRETIMKERFGIFFQQLGRKVDSIACGNRYREHLAEDHQLLGNSKEIIADLAQKADLYVVTNGVSTMQHKRLKASGLAPYFKHVFVSEETGYQKPMKEFFDYVFERLPHAQKETTAIIGDSLSADIKGGQAANISTIWLNRGQKSDAQIKPDHEIKDLAELYQIL